MTDTTTQERLEAVRKGFDPSDSLVAWRKRLCDGAPSNEEAPRSASGDYSISYEAVRQYHNEGRSPPVHYLLRLEELFDVPLQWLATGSGEMVRGQRETQRIASQTDDEMIDDLSVGPSVPADLRHRPIATLLADTVKRRLEIESVARRRLDDEAEVSRKEIIRWVHELAQHVEDPSKPLPWDLPTDGWDIGTEVWISAATSTIHGIRHRLSGGYRKHRIDEVRRERHEQDTEEGNK